MEILGSKFDYVLLLSKKKKSLFDSFQEKKILEQTKTSFLITFVAVIITRAHNLLSLIGHERSILFKIKKGPEQPTGRILGNLSVQTVVSVHTAPCKTIKLVNGNI